ncbi:unnamed protein product [Rotaria sp. Silwood2]|nr:unnamed protein product [Rotaria sp. Silwood2]
MSVRVNPNIAYVLKNLDEIRHDNRKRKQDFIVQYRENKSLESNNHLSKEETQLQPKVEVENIDHTTCRTFIMVNPDAPNRDDVIKSSYNRLASPVGSSLHRYIFLFYQSIDKIPEKKIEREQRFRFPLQQYVTDNRLEFLDVTYFTVNN